MCNRALILNSASRGDSSTRLYFVSVQAIDKYETFLPSFHGGMGIVSTVLVSALAEKGLNKGGIVYILG